MAQLTSHLLRVDFLSAPLNDRIFLGVPATLLVSLEELLFSSSSRPPGNRVCPPRALPAALAWAPGHTRRVPGSCVLIERW